MSQPPETTYTPNGSQYEANQSFTMLSQRFQEFTSSQSQYYRMAWLPPLLVSATPSELMTQQTQLCFILWIHSRRECEESEETCLLSQFPAHTSSAVVSHHIFFLSPAWLSDHWACILYFSSSRLCVCPPGAVQCITILSCQLGLNTENTE